MWFSIGMKYHHQTKFWINFNAKQLFAITFLNDRLTYLNFWIFIKWHLSVFPFIRLLENYLKILAARLVKLQLSRQYYSILYKWYFHWYRLQYLYNKLLKPNLFGSFNLLLWKKRSTRCARFFQQSKAVNSNNKFFGSQLSISQFEWKLMSVHIYDAKEIPLLLLWLRKKCPHSELLWSVFSRIRTEYGKIFSPYSVQIRENTDQNNSKYGQFLPSV